MQRVVSAGLRTYHNAVFAHQPNTPPGARYPAGEVLRFHAWANLLKMRASFAAAQTAANTQVSARIYVFTERTLRLTPSEGLRLCRPTLRVASM